MKLEESPTDRPGIVASCLAGAAEGALAMAALAVVEIVLRPSPGPALVSPLADLSRLAIAGAVAGGSLGILRSARRLSAISPFGIVLGVGVALELWMQVVAGERVIRDAAREALRGGLFVIVGAIAGQLLGAGLRRLLRLRPRPVRDLVVVLALAIPAFLPGPSGTSPLDRPNVLLLTIDTLRADRLGHTGCPRSVSPHLDRLARRGVGDVRAVTPLPRTLPAFASIMTGRLPHSHGVRDNFHYSLGLDARTLAEELRGAGWATAAVNSNPVISHASGLYQGFDSANDRGDDWSRLGLIRGVRRIVTLLAMRSGDRAQVITDLALEWLGRRPRDRPFFLWVHWLAPHMPYEPAYPFDRIFDPDYRGEYRYALTYEQVSKGDMTYRNPLDPETLRHASALYDGEVATADRALGRLLRSMDLAGDLEDTLILFTSDHGESLDEHGYFFNHGDFVYGPAANVPVIFVTPDDASGPTVRRAGASLIDWYPRIWTAVTGEDPPPGLDEIAPDLSHDLLFGESGFCRFPHLNQRLGWLLPREIAQNPDLVPDWREKWEPQANRAKQRFVEVDGWKLVLSPRPDGDAYELFDLLADPGETTNVADRHRERTIEMAELIRRWIDDGESRRTTAGDLSIDAATREAMKSLGYVGD